MNNTKHIKIQGIPENLEPQSVAVFTSRLHDAVDKFLRKVNLDSIHLNISSVSEVPSNTGDARVQGVNLERKNSEVSTLERSSRYSSKKPLFSFDQLVIPETVLEELLLAIDLIHLKSKVFDKWGLKRIEPFPRSLLNFYGEPGTGKTLAAHAIAANLGLPILVTSYAQLESMYHGEGPKNIEAVFLAAKRENAVLFVDEAESLLSKRFINVTQGSEEAINSMRSQLLIGLEQFQGIAIFATNLIERYDRAFETRIRNIYFPMPDENCRRQIWQKHLPQELPLADDVSLDILAKVEELCGRDIKNAVIDAAMRVARGRREYIELNDLLTSVERIKASKVRKLVTVHGE